jgi:hypothetical protein
MHVLKSKVEVTITIREVPPYGHRIEKLIKLQHSILIQILEKNEKPKTAMHAIDYIYIANSKKVVLEKS